jgi:hypothetical protein
VEGTTELLVLEAELVPLALVAVTVKVYDVPLVKPVTVIGEPPLVAVWPRLDVTVYEVIADPPLLPGALNVIVAWPLPAVAVPIVGVPGVVEGVAAADADELVPVPETFIATTLKV